MVARKYARIFVLRHYLFLKVRSFPRAFPRATLSEICSFLGTDKVQGQMSEHISAPNGGYCLFIPKPDPGRDQLFMSSQFSSSSTFGKYSLYVADDVHSLNISAKVYPMRKLIFIYNIMEKLNCLLLDKFNKHSHTFC